MTTIETIRGLLSECEAAWRAQGATGEVRYTAADLDHVCQTLGRKPTAAEWADAGLASVGSKHVAEGE